MAQISDIIGLLKRVLGLVDNPVSRFDECVDFVLAHETEYDKFGNVRTEHDGNDPGGRTRYGIDQRSHPQINVDSLTLAQAKQIYHDDEWTKCRCEDLGQPWDLPVFDTAVNLGKSYAITLLQKTVGATVDGFIGPKTVAAAKARPELVGAYLTARENHYRGLNPKLVAEYLKGWLNRTSDLRKSLALA